LPKEWLEDKERCKSAGIPEQTEFATKPELARQMIQKAIEESN
jgi:SRSO17 transposase